MCYNSCYAVCGGMKYMFTIGLERFSDPYHHRLDLEEYSHNHHVFSRVWGVDNTRLFYLAKYLIFL